MVGREDVIAQKIRRQEIVIVADDLSGAADCAVSCAVRGLRAVVQLAAEDPAFAQVLAIDAATRGMPADRAAATAERLFAAHRDSRVFYKKIDSLLRGHVGPELAAMLHDAAPAVAVMAPALPAQGRVTIGGCVWLRGERVAGADAPRVLAAAGLTSAVIGLDLIRSGQLVREMTTLAKRADVLVCDAETDEDLRAIAAAIAVLPRETIWVGSAGLARHIPGALGIGGGSEPAEDPPRIHGPVLVVAGSRSPVAHEQIRAVGVKTVFLTPEQLRSGSGLTLDLSGDLVIAIEAAEETVEDPGLSAALAVLIAPHMDQIGALVVTGGETARAVLTRSGITSLLLLQEVEAGVPLAISAGARTMPVITKSGSFGNRATLAHCVELLRRLKLE